MQTPYEILTQSRAPRTSSSQIITCSRLMTNLLPEATGPRTIRAVSWNTWNNKTSYFRLKRSQGFTILVTTHTLNRCWRARKRACKERNDRTLPTSGQLVVEDRSSCRYSWTGDWYSARQASISLPLIHPHSKSPPNETPSSCNGAWLSLPMTIAGQNQLNPCPVLERSATVDSTEFVNSSRIPSLELSLQIRTPNLIESRQNPRPTQQLSIGRRGKHWVICQDILFPMLRKRQRRYLLKLLEKAVDEVS